MATAICRFTCLHLDISPMTKTQRKKDRYCKFNAQENRIGTRDLRIKDEIINQAQNWLNDAPIVDNTHTSPKRTLTSLSVICAESLARHSELLTKKQLQWMPWSAARILWRILCERNLDTHGLFLHFVSLFGREQDFRCHWPCEAASSLKKLSSSDRYRINLLRRYQRYPNIRFQLIPLNASLMPFIDQATTEECPLLYMLDLNGVCDKFQFYKDIMQLKLLALDVSGIPIPKHLIPTWKLAMKNGNWRSMRVLITDDAKEFLDMKQLLLIGSRNPIQEVSNRTWQRKQLSDSLANSLSAKYIIIKNKLKDVPTCPLVEITAGSQWQSKPFPVSSIITRVIPESSMETKAVHCNKRRSETNAIVKSLQRKKLPKKVGTIDMNKFLG